MSAVPSPTATSAMAGVVVGNGTDLCGLRRRKRPKRPDSPATGRQANLTSLPRRAVFVERRHAP